MYRESSWRASAQTLADGWRKPGKGWRKPGKGWTDSE